jgi:hypothetical protein
MRLSGKTADRATATVVTFLLASVLPGAPKYEFKAGRLLEVSVISDSPTDRSVIFKLQIGDVLYTSTISADSAIITNYPSEPDKKPTVEDFTPGNDVQAAIDGKTLILLTPAGKQLKTKIQLSRNPKLRTDFSVVTEDALHNTKQGLSPDDVKWFLESIEQKYPKACYVDPAPSVAVVFYVTVTPDTYHGTRVVESESTQSSPVTGTITDESGNQSQVQGTVKTTTSSSTAVPYSVEYGIFTLAVERRGADGKFAVLQRFQQKGLYKTVYGIPLGGKGYHPLHPVIEDAAKWIDSGGLTDPRQGAVP